MKISVIIFTIPERAIFLSSILSNLARQNYLPDEVLVITDNGKWEGIREIMITLLKRNTFLGISKTLLVGW